MFDTETAKEAGKISRRGQSERTRLLNELFNPDKAREVFIKLQDMAVAGDMDAIKTYLAYCFGKPKEMIDIKMIGGIQVFMRRTPEITQLEPIIGQNILTNGTGNGNSG